MKFIIYLLLLFTATVLFSCSNNGGNKDEKGETDSSTVLSSTDSSLMMFSPSSIGVTLDKPVESSDKSNEDSNTSRKVRVVIHTMEGYGVDTAFAKQAAALLERVVNSTEFESAVAGESYSHNQGLSPRQIYEKVMLADEVDGPGGSTGVIDLRLRVITAERDGNRWIRNCRPGSRAGTIGIDGGGSGIAAVCPQWLRSTSQGNRPEELAAHFIHEYMHILNFSHPSQKSESVPYKIHAIVEEVGKKM